MRVRIAHVTAYSYSAPASSVAQILRVTPRGHAGQFVVDWRIELDCDSRLQAAQDAFGNTVHSFTLPGPIGALTVTATGEVETEDTNGVVAGQIERFPPTIFLRDTRLSTADEAIRDFADSFRGTALKDRLTTLHDLSRAINARMTYDTAPTDAQTSAAEAFGEGVGVCQDFAHIFIAAARHLDIPARYVGGYLFQPDVAVQEAGHGWAEALVEGLGWVAFDPANARSATDAYVRVAVGLDYLGAAPVRGTQYGGSHEKLAVSVRVEDAGTPSADRLQWQSQSQS